MERTELNARTAGSQPAVQKGKDRPSCDWDDSTEDAANQAPEREEVFNLPPHNREAEEAVLGAVLINPESYEDLVEFLCAEDFYIVRHGWIWQTFANLREHGQPLDYLTVVNDLAQRNHLDEIGGPAYVMRLINQTPSSMHAVAYGHMVEEAATCRRLAHAANQIAKAAYRKPQDANRALNEAEQAVFNVSLRRATREMQSAQAAMSDLYDQVADRAAGKLKGIPTGFLDLDELLGGLHGSDLIIVGARPAVGKTSFITSLALHIASKEKKHVAVFSLEMSTEQLSLRLAAQQSRINSQRLRSGQLEEGEWETFTRTIETLGELPMYFDDSPALTPSQLRSKCRKLRLQNRLDLIVVDYLQLIASDGRFENRVQEVGHISRQLKVLARELDVPVLTAAQLSRAVEMRTDKRPMLSDLRESGLDPGTIPAEVKLFKSVSGRMPKRDQWPLIVRAWKDQPYSRELLLPFWEAWVARDHKRTSLGWLDWVSSGVIPESWAKNSSRPGHNNEPKGFASIRKVVEEHRNGDL